MRRLLRNLAAGQEVSGDTSTLEDRSVLDKLREETGDKTMKTRVPWYIERRAESLAIVYLTRRDDLIISQPTPNRGNEGDEAEEQTQISICSIF